MYVHGALVAVAVHVPDLVHQLASGKNFIGVGEQLEKEQKFLLGQLDSAGGGERLAVRADHEGVVIQHGLSHRELALVDDAGAAKQRADPQDHLLLVHRLGHVIVRTHDKALALVSRGLLGGDHQNGNVAAALAQGTGKLVAVHAGHHQVKHDQIHVLDVQLAQGILAVDGHNGIISVPFQYGAHEATGVVVVLNYHDRKHRLLSFLLGVSNRR